LTCLALAFATFGYMQRSTAEAVDDLPRTPLTDCGKHNPVLGCLQLYDN
jgi:hypothetical protein